MNRNSHPTQRITGALSLLLAGSLLLAACSSNETPTSNAQPSAGNVAAVTIVAPNATAAPSQPEPAVAAPVAATNAPTHEKASDATWDAATEIPITLNGNAITANHPSVTVSEGRALIKAAGTYRLSGTLADGQIAINTKDKGVVRLILDGVNINSTKGSAIVFEDADRAILVLADNTQNTVTDSENYVFPDPTVKEPNAAIFSMSDLTIDGGGALTVEGRFNDGIASKDGLVIARGTFVVNAADDAIRGKDYLVIRDGTFTINAPKGDGLKADNQDDATKGYVQIDNGKFEITAGGDGIQAQTDLWIRNGAYTVVTGGGSTVKPAEGVSAKGLKSGARVRIEDGVFAINAADDAVNTNGNFIINGGQMSIATGDDGIHANVALQVDGGSVRITQAYEGIESTVITINNGEIDITSSDDGINVGADTQGGGPGGGQHAAAAPGQEVAAYTGSNFLYVNGGRIVVRADGDGVDVNGAAEMTGGTIIVNGPTMPGNGALDYNAYFKISGGQIVATGSNGMAQTPGLPSTQLSLLAFFTELQPAGTLVHVRTQAGEPLMTFAPDREFQSLAYSSVKLKQGETYEILLGGNANGTAANGLYTEADYTPGTVFQAFTISNTVTMLGTGGGFGGPGGGQGNHAPGEHPQQPAQQP